MAMNEIGIADLKNRLSKHLRALGVAAAGDGFARHRCATVAAVPTAPR